MNEPSFTWFVKVLALRFLVCEGIALLVVSPCLGFAHPILLLPVLGFLIIGYFVRMAWRRGSTGLWSDPGCSVFLLALLTTLMVVIGLTGAHLAGLCAAWPVETAWGLFAFLGLLAPAVYHWNIIEQCYYQVLIARRLQHELGFRSETNTLEGAWPTGHKYLYFQHIEPGGLMDQAGVQPQDIVVAPRCFTEFWYRLEKAHGAAPISIAVVSWADPRPVSQRPRRQVMIRIPPR